MALYQLTQEPKEKQLKRLLQELLAQEDGPPIVPRYPKHSEAIEPWKRAMASGTLTGKVFSHHTVENYARYAYEFLGKQPKLSFENFQTELELIPPESFGRRDKYFKAILCFTSVFCRQSVSDSAQAPYSSQAGYGNRRTIGGVTGSLHKPAQSAHSASPLLHRSSGF
jgi:hypothetical protein